jgi:hypothetical protein
VRRLRSLEEAEESVWHDPDDARLWPAIAGVWELAERLCPRRLPPCVYRHRTIEEANRQTETWEAAAVRRATGSGGADGPA